MTVSIGYIHINGVINSTIQTGDTATFTVHAMSDASEL